MVPSRLLGAGYESFWSGERLVRVWVKLGVTEGGIIQAHNGYIETYLNLGMVGLVLLVARIGGGLLKAMRQLNTEYVQAVLCIAYILTAVLYNYTEAAFKPMNNVFVLLLLSIMWVPSRPSGKARTATHPSKSDRFRTLVPQAVTARRGP
jgi:O-antigen ligase